MSKLSALISLTLLFTTFSLGQEREKPNPKAMEAMSKGDFRGSISILDSDIEKRKNVFASYKLRAEIKSFTGDFAGAFADLSKAIEIDSTEGSLYQRRADIRPLLGHASDRILEDLDLAIVNGVKHEKVYASRGSIRSSLGDIEGAIADYKLAIGLRPGHALATVGLAMAYRKKGDDDTAIKILEDFIATIEDSEKRLRPIGGTVVASNSVLTPSSGGAIETTTLLTRESVFLKRPPTAEELERNSDRMMQTKNSALAYTHLASLYEKRRDLEKALLTSDKAIKIDPNDFYALGTRGIIKLGLADFDGAVVDFDRAIRITPKNGSLYLNRGLAYLLMNKQTEAQRDFDKYLELVPNGKETLNAQIEYAKRLHGK